MSSSYFESLGRKESEPFTYDELNYAETEPDLVEATNKQIDENIKDRKQFFQDNITLYNQTMEARSKRWSDLAKLTKSGKEILDRRRTYKEGENKWDGYWAAYTDPKTKSEFISNAILYENENKEIKVEGSREVGTMLSTGESSDGVPMKPTDIADFNLVIQSGDFDNGIQAINEMNAHLPTYMKIAENSLMVNGKLYKDMSYSEKQHWRKIAYARYAEMWMAEHPEITERLIISKFVGNVKGVERDWDATASDIHKDATNEIATGYQTIGLINNIKAASANYYNGNQDAIVHSLFSQDSYIQQRVALYEAQGMENAYKLANDDFISIITAPENIGLFTENEIRYLTQIHKFVPEGQKDGKTYDDIQSQNVEKIYNAWNKHKEKESKEFLENEFKVLEQQVIEGDTVSWNQLADYLAHPELRNSAKTLFELSEKNRNALNQSEFDIQRRNIHRNIETYVQNNFTESKDYNWRYNKEGAILAKAEAHFNEKLKHYQSINQENAGALAAQDVIKELNAGTWDNVNTAVYTNGDRGNDLIAAREAFNTDFNKTLNSKDAHSWEQPYIANAYEFFQPDSNVQLDGYWTQLAKDHPGVSPFKLAHDRLVALKYIKPDPRFGTTLNMPKTDIELLITKPDFAKINRVILSSDENMNEVLNSLIDPKVNDNGGLDAIKVNNKYQPLNEEVKLSEMTVGEIVQKIRSGEISRDTELGLYGLKGDAFIDLALHADLDLTRTFDQNTQTLVLLERLRYKSNNRLQFRDSDFTYRRLVNVPEEDREEFKRIIGDLGPFMDLNTLLPVAANDLVENNMN